MINYNLSEEEQSIEDNIEGLRPVGKEKRTQVERIIDRARKNRAISLRISNYDLEKIKKIAEEEGVPYQTLINMVLHKYISGRLLDKEEFKKMIHNMLKEKEAI